VYSEVGILESVEIMFPGNKGIGMAMDAAVNNMNEAKKIGVALMFFSLCYP